MNPKRKKAGKAFWSKVEDAGEAMEFAMRCLFAVGFAALFAVAAYTIGSAIWVGIGLILALCVIPVGLLIGFFWLEVKFALRLLISLWF